MGIMLDKYLFEDDFTVVTEAHPLEGQFEGLAAELFVCMTGDSDPVHSFVLRSPDEADAKIQSIVVAGGFWAGNWFYPYHNISYFIVK